MTAFEALSTATTPLLMLVASPVAQGGSPEAGSLGLSEVLSLIKDYDGQIDTIWNIYVGGITLILAALTASTWKPDWRLLSGLFVIFAAGNAWSLHRYYSFHAALVTYAQALNDARLNPVLFALDLPASAYLLVFHGLLDLLVVVAIVLLTRKAPKAAIVESN